MNHHVVLHLVLSVIYLLTAAILFVEAAYAHSGCATLAALIYGLIAWFARQKKS